jgi:hypothetical protein
LQVNGPAAALVAATDYTLLVLGSIVVTVFLTSLLLSVIFCRCVERAGFLLDSSQGIVENGPSYWRLA